MTVEDNTVTQAGPYVQTEGIVIGYTRDHNDKVRRNTASGLEVGSSEPLCDAQLPPNTRGPEDPSIPQPRTHHAHEPG